MCACRLVGQRGRGGLSAGAAQARLDLTVLDDDWPEALIDLLTTLAESTSAEVAQ